MTGALTSYVFTLHACLLALRGHLLACLLAISHNYCYYYYYCCYYYYYYY